MVNEEREEEKNKVPDSRPEYLAPWKPEQLLVVPLSPAVANKP